MGTEEILYGDFPIGQFVAVPHAPSGAEHLNLEFTEAKTTLPSFPDDHMEFFGPATDVDPNAMNIYHVNCKYSWVIILESVIVGFEHPDESIRAPLPFSLGISLWLGSRVLKTIGVLGVMSSLRPLSRSFIWSAIYVR
jgi:hypothetical protein